MTTTASTPPYRRLAADLRQRIEAGEFGPGDQLPSIPVLARDLSISRQTAQRAVDVLRDEGLTTTVPGRGTYVRAALPMSDRDAPRRYRWEKNRALITDDHQRGETGNSEHDIGLAKNEFEFFARYEHSVMTPEIASIFGCPNGTPVLNRHYKTMIRTTGLLTGFSCSYVPLALFEQNPALLDSSNEPWPGGTMHQLRTVGVEVARIDDIVTARPATERDTRVLALPSGSAVIHIRKVSVSTTGDVVEVSDLTMPAYNVTLRFSTPLDPWPPES